MNKAIKSVIGLSLVAEFLLGCSANVLGPGESSVLEADKTSGTAQSISRSKARKNGEASCDEVVDAVCYTISADFEFESKFVDVRGSKIHYVEEGEGDPIVFVHGNPTWSYLWRNILPYAAEDGRAIAIDLIGMGRSDKPNIDYRLSTCRSSRIL